MLFEQMQENGGILKECRDEHQMYKELLLLLKTLCDLIGMEALHCKSEKATKLFAELDSKKGVGLIERVRQGQGKPSIIYVKNFAANPPVPP